MRYLIIFSISFFPFTQIKSQVGFTQTGKASFYNDRFHGAKTNSGEKYDMNAFTAAHRELPLNTKIKVTNLKNNKTVVLRRNDRGPFHHVRILDVSKAAAKELDIISQGVANVTIEVVETPEPVKDKDAKSISTPTSTAKQNKAPVAEHTAVVTAKTETKLEKNESKNEPKLEPEINTKTTSNDINTTKANTVAAIDALKPEPEKPTVDLKEASSDIFKVGHIYNLHGMIQNPKGFGIQVGSFSHIFNTLKFCRTLTDMGFAKIFIKADKESSGATYRVFIGDYLLEEDANPEIAKLREKNRDYLVKKYPENKDLL